MAPFKTLCLSIGFCAATATVALADITFKGGNGSSQKQAVVIMESNGKADGGEAEYRCITKTFPAWRTDSQSLIAKSKHHYDIITIHKAGARRTLYCDISNDVVACNQKGMSDPLLEHRAFKWKHLNAQRCLANKG